MCDISSDTVLPATDKFLFLKNLESGSFYGGSWQFLWRKPLASTQVFLHMRTIPHVGPGAKPVMSKKHTLTLGYMSTLLLSL